MHSLLQARERLSLSVVRPLTEKKKKIYGLFPLPTLMTSLFGEKVTVYAITIDYSILWNFSEKLQIVTENSSINSR